MFFVFASWLCVLANALKRHSMINKWRAKKKQAICAHSTCNDQVRLNRIPYFFSPYVYCVYSQSSSKWEAYNAYRRGWVYNFSCFQSTTLNYVYRIQWEPLTTQLHLDGYAFFSRNNWFFNWLLPHSLLV